jgi:pimeloyl-ACP methyl ester carboxylesterase
MAYRESVPSGWMPGDPVALLVHGWPESSYMWRHLLPALAGAGWRAIAPDLPGYGDSPPDPPGTWERHVEALERFRSALELDRVALVVHDWGVMIGLRWACDHPDAVRALVISDGGFFADRRWHDLAQLMRTPGEGEKLIEGFTEDGFAAGLRAVSTGITDDALAEYWKCFADPVRRLGSLELYRSGDFDKLVAYEPRLAALDVPALVLWGAEDRFAGVTLAERFHARLAGSRLLVVPDVGHFVWEDAPEQCNVATSTFLGELAAVQSS